MPKDSGGSNTTTQEFKPPDWTQDLWKGYANQAGQLSSEAQPAYNMPRLAPLNDMQNTGLQMAADNAINGDPSTNAARQAATLTAQGGYLQSNPYINTNPYLNSSIADTTQNMAAGFANGTAAQNDAGANMAGAYGGSGWALKQALDAQGLERNIGQMATQARNTDWTNQAGQYDAERNRMTQAQQMAPQWAGLDQQAIKTLTGAGDAYQANAQKGLDQAYGDFQQAQQYPLQQLENLGSALSRASGTYAGGGTQSGSGTSPGMSPLAGLLGGAGLGYGAYTSGFFG